MGAEGNASMCTEWMTLCRKLSRSCVCVCVFILMDQTNILFGFILIFVYSVLNMLASNVEILEKWMMAVIYAAYTRIHTLISYIIY